MAMKGSGVKLCEEAFERLVAGRPEVDKHKGLPKSKITKSIVSVEAGFDPGYLKKGRKLHVPLLARIEAVQGEQDSAEAVAAERVRRANMTVQKARSELEIMREQRNAALTQNLQLHARLLGLEKKMPSLSVTPRLH